MLVVDGDSVAHGVLPETKAIQTWPYRVAEALHDGVTVLASSQSIAADCVKRLPRVYDLHPSIYLLQVGQWAQNHEPLKDFIPAIHTICWEMAVRSIGVVLISPPHQFTVLCDDFWRYVSVLRESAQAMRLGKFVDVTDVTGLQCYDNDGSSVVCHYSPAGAEEVARRIVNAIR